MNTPEQNHDRMEDAELGRLGRNETGGAKSTPSQALRLMASLAHDPSGRTTLKLV